MKTPPSPRIDALDAVRGAAMLLGTLVHACTPYMQVPMRGLIMPVQEASASRVPDVIFWTLHAFRVPLFFVVAGFVAREMLQGKGAAHFLENRVRRVLIPLLIAYPVVTFFMHIIWLWGWDVRGWANWKYFGKFRYDFDGQRYIWGFNHFWFLEYLFVYSMVLWALWRPAIALFSIKNSGRGAKVQVVRAADVQFGEQSARREEPVRHGRGVLAILALGLAAGVLAAGALSRNVSFWLDFQNSYVPGRWALAYYGVFFALGAAIRRSWLRGLMVLGPLLLVVAAACVWPMLRLVLSSVWETEQGPRQGQLIDSPGERERLVLLVSTAAVAASLGFLGVAAALIRRLSRVGRFLTDASYWVYITHLPWVGLGVMLLHWTPLLPEIKMVLVTIFAVGVSLVTFLPLRHRRIGRALGAGRRASSPADVQSAGRAVSA